MTTVCVASPAGVHINHRILETCQDCGGSGLVAGCGVPMDDTAMWSGITCGWKNERCRECNGPCLTCDGRGLVPMIPEAA